MGARRIQAGAKGASGKTESCIVNRVCHRQLGLLGGVMHEGAIVGLGAGRRAIKSERHGPVPAPGSSERSHFARRNLV